MLGFIASLFKPAVDLVDTLHVSDEERGKIKAKLMELETKLHDQVAQVVKAEASSEHWFVAAWRPMLIVILTCAVLLDGHFGLVFDGKVYTLLETFLGVYAGGRSLEKISKFIKK